MKRLIIGLTGPIGSGKNEVAKILAKRGAYVIDVDRVGHKVIEPGTEGWKKIVKNFGIQVLYPSGKVNRKKLAAIVFSSPKQLEILNKITHPLILKAVKTEINRNKLKNIVINAALLTKIGMDKLCDKVWVVTASKKIRIKRLKKRGLSPRPQPSDREYIKQADIVIRNNCKLSKLVIPKIEGLS